ncbi:MAG: hypothetical protein Q7S22_08135 [Candidatus Micrarchaeota archaeon]|nr:hypothetical protein [Candidatus Micrarchaeota archaeon]
MEYRERKVLIDTNFFLIPHQFGIDIFTELNNLLDNYAVFVTSTLVINELKEIAKGKGDDGIAARFAQKLIEKSKIEIVKAEGYTDMWLLTYAKEHNAIVCTNDVNLKRKLKDAKLKVILLKSKSKIGFV